MVHRFLLHRRWKIDSSWSWCSRREIYFIVSSSKQIIRPSVSWVRRRRSTFLMHFKLIVQVRTEASLRAQTTAISALCRATHVYGELGPFLNKRKSFSSVNAVISARINLPTAYMTPCCSKCRSVYVSFRMFADKINYSCHFVHTQVEMKYANQIGA